MRQLQKWSDSLLVIENSCSSRDKVHLSEFVAISDDLFAWLIDSAIHIHNKLVLETNISIQEEIAKLIFERPKQRL